MRRAACLSIRRAASPRAAWAGCALVLPTLHSRPMSTRPPHETAPQDVIPRDAARFRRTLVRVLAMQVVTLVVLWLMQLRYTA